MQGHKRVHHVNFLQPHQRGVQHFSRPEYSENSGKCISITLSTHVETVVKLSLKKDTPKIEVTMEPDEESNYTPEEKATYQERIRRDKCSSLPGCKGDTGGYQKAAG